ncbi:MAG: arsenate reductase ArsC [Thaumarchaeota archaeon]|nr:MAG: arsenate reductase ArsC [Nitrososphaerota archaeon]
MKFFKREPEKSILFVCVENAGRSQMAEGFFNKYAPKGYRAISAGTKPVSQINPLAVEVMREVDIDINTQKSKELTDDMIRNSSNIVNMGCMEKESCPTLFLHNLLDWNIEDPKDKPIEKLREIRDEIDQRVKELVAGIKTHQ